MRRNRFTPAPRGTFSEVHMQTACSNIDACCLREVAMMVPQRFTREQILPWFFPDDALAKLRAVKGMVETDSIKSYEVTPDVNLHIQYKNTASTPAIEANVWMPNMQRCAPMMEVIRIIEQIHEKYGRVKHLLRWFNANATEGAVRTYWPAAMSLCPQSSVAQMVAAPTRYNTPAGIGAMLPLIRETAGTVAAMALVPNDIAPHAHNDLKLILGARKRTWEDTEISLDSQFFNL